MVARFSLRLCTVFERAFRNFHQRLTHRHYPPPFVATVVIEVRFMSAIVATGADLLVSRCGLLAAQLQFILV